MSQNSAAAMASAVASDATSECDTLLRQVQGLIDESRSISNDPRRASERFPVGYAFQFTPIDVDGNLLHDEVRTIFGKDLSVSGIGFSHDFRPLYRRAVISLTDPMLGRFAVEVEIVWTRPTPIGLFETGCRLLRTVAGHKLRSMTLPTELPPQG